MAENYPIEEEIFTTALEYANPDERTAYLRRVCADKADLRVRVEALLGAQEYAGTFLVSPLLNGEQPVTGERPVEYSGTVIDHYKLLERIGEGGFGDVYLAEQQQPVRRQVALKIIKLGMDTRQVIARFEAERQALAMMDHPNIAKVHDAGATETGRPYFVMELVRGVPITEYCDTNHLATKDRLTLFIDVCHAVQHAHQKGIIHRDIKPTNVMVTLVDDKPVPKVIDFGIAKATQQRLTEKTFHTSYHQLIGTPQYMSPEQAAMCDQDVDTRSDIYSLGVLLYELLSGTTPLDSDALRGSSYDEICRTIRETEPQVLSKRLSTLGDALTTVSEHRRVPPAVLTRQLRGDLDWIVMKALEKKRDDRYATARELAEDVERHLRKEPIHAKKPSLVDHVTKWSSRHRAAVWSAAAVLAVAAAALSVSTFVTSRAYRREAIERKLAEREAKRAKQSDRKAREAVDFMFTRTAEQLRDVARMQQVRRELLERALKFYQGFLQHAATDPQVQYEAALAWRRVGAIYAELGNYDQVDAPYARAIEALRKLCAAATSGSTSLSQDPAGGAGRPGKLAQADRFRMGSKYKADLIRTFTQHALTLVAERFVDLKQRQAVAELDEALQLCQELLRESPNNGDSLRLLASTHVMLGGTLHPLGKFDAAEEHLRKGIAAWSRFAEVGEAGADDLRRMAEAHLKLAVLLNEMVRLSQADNQLRAASDLNREAGVHEGDASRRRRFQKGRILATQGKLDGLRRRYAEAQATYDEAIRVATALVADFPDYDVADRFLGHWYRELSAVLLGRERLAEAEEALQQSITIAQRIADKSPDFWKNKIELGTLHYKLGTLFHWRGRQVEASRSFAMARDLLEQVAAAASGAPRSNRRLVVLLATCPDPRFRDPRRAARLAREGVADGTEHGRFWQLLGVAEYQAGNDRAAIDALETSCRLHAGGDAFDRLFLAMAHWRLGDRKTTMRRFEEIRDPRKAGPELNADFTPLDLKRFRAEADALRKTDKHTTPSIVENQEKDKS